MAQKLKPSDWSGAGGEDCIAVAVPVYDFFIACLSIWSWNKGHMYVCIIYTWHACAHADF